MLLLVIWFLENKNKIIFYFYFIFISYFCFCINKRIKNSCYISIHHTVFNYKVDRVVNTIIQLK